MKNKQLFQQLKLELNRKLDELEDQMNQDNPYLKSLDSETSAMYGELQTEYYVQL